MKCFFSCFWSASGLPNTSLRLVEGLWDGDEDGVLRRAGSDRRAAGGAARW